MIFQKYQREFSISVNRISARKWRIITSKLIEIAVRIMMISHHVYHHLDDLHTHCQSHLVAEMSVILILDELLVFMIRIYSKYMLDDFNSTDKWMMIDLALVKFSLVHCFSYSSCTDMYIAYNFETFSCKNSCSIVFTDLSYYFLHLIWIYDLVSFSEIDLTTYRLWKNVLNNTTIHIKIFSYSMLQ